MAMQARQYEGTIALAEIWTAVSATIPSVASGSGGVITVNLPTGSQAAPGDFASLGEPAAWGPLLLDAAVSAIGQIQIAYRNDSGSTVNVGAQLVNVLIERMLTQGN